MDTPPFFIMVTTSNGSVLSQVRNIRRVYRLDETWHVLLEEGLPSITIKETAAQVDVLIQNARYQAIRGS